MTTALTVTLPDYFCARDVHLHAEKVGRRWRLCAVDSVGNAWPVASPWRVDDMLYGSKSLIVERLEKAGHKIGDRLFAQPLKRF